jgi:hypothetical protein
MTLCALTPGLKAGAWGAHSGHKHHDREEGEQTDAAKEKRVVFELERYVKKRVKNGKKTSDHRCDLFLNPAKTRSRRTAIAVTTILNSIEDFSLPSFIGSPFQIDLKDQPSINRK